MNATVLRSMAPAAGGNWGWRLSSVGLARNCHFSPLKATLIRDTRMAIDWYEAEATCDSKDIVLEMGGR